MNNFKFALRSLLKTPAVSLIAVITLASGIGASVAMFSLMNALLLRPLAFKNPGQLLKLERAWDRSRSDTFSPADYFDFQQNLANTPNQGIAAASAFSSVSLAEPGRPPEWQNSLRVTPNYFELLGLAPELGRAFTAEDNLPGNRRVIVLSHSLWQEQFGGARDIIGKLVRLDGDRSEVIGVLPASAHERRLFGNARLFRPLALTEADATNRSLGYLNIFFRRAENMSDKQAAAFIASVGARVAADHPAQNKNVRWQSRDLLSSTMKPTGRALVTMLVGLSAFVLLIACSNLANLLLARAMNRAREFAVRAALGASRLQLALPLTFESLTLAITGGAAALLVSKWTCDWLQRQIVDSGDAGMNLAIDWRVLAFTAGISLLTVLIFGVTPALFATRVSLEEALKSQSRGATANRGHHRLRSALIIGQFALAMTLLAGAGFFLRGAQKALNENNGWSSAQVIQGIINFPKGYRADSELNTFFAQLIERLEAVPGADAASISYGLPYRGLNNHRRYVVQGRDNSNPDQYPMVLANGISPRYFEVTGTQLLTGRAFNAADTKGGLAVAIISQSMASALFKTENPIGQRIAVDGVQPPEWREVVGVVNDVSPADVAQQPIANQVYEPITYDHWYFGEGKLVPVHIAVRASRVPAEKMIASIREAIAAVDPDLPIRELMTADAMIARFTGQMHVIKKLITAFAVIGLGLAALGIYGVLARTVAQRTSEIGIRMALGAQVTDTIRLILNFGLRLAGAGAILGLLGAFAIGRVIQNALPSMQSNNALILPLATTALVLVALIASYLPARRAAKIDPAVALRNE
jgi:putative ABC transport system permease protein